MGGIGWLGMGGLCRLLKESTHLPPERCLIQLPRLKQGIQEQQRGNLGRLVFHYEPPAILNLVAGGRSKLVPQVRPYVKALLSYWVARILCE